VFRRAIQEAESSQEAPATAERAPVVARTDDWSVDEQPEPEEQERIEPPPPRPPARQERAVARKAETYLPSQGYVEERPRPDEPRLAPDYDYEWDPDSAPRPAAATAREPAVDAVGNERYSRPRPQRRQARRDDADDVEALERRARPSSLPTILLLVLILVMLVGLGVLGWSQRAIVADLLGGFDSRPAAAPTVTTSHSPATKDGESLLGSGDAASPATDEPPADNVRVVTTGSSGAPASPAPAMDAAPTIISAANSQAASSITASALVAQKATLYEEPADPSAAANGVVAIKAAVTWAAEKTSDGQAIVGNIDVPDRGMRIKLTLRPNLDKTLPASQVVEVTVETPPNFPGKGIRDIPRIVMKPAEDGRGQPLIGASAKVADGFFWVALSSVAADVSANLGILKQREWIDLPILYESGQRAILTFEKGTSGDRVFDQVLSSWTAGG
jgi:hypothetical protein